MKLTEAALRKIIKEEVDKIQKKPINEWEARPIVVPEKEIDSLRTYSNMGKLIEKYGGGANGYNIVKRAIDGAMSKIRTALGNANCNQEDRDYYNQPSDVMEKCGKLFTLGTVSEKLAKAYKEMSSKHKLGTYTGYKPSKIERQKAKAQAAADRAAREAAEAAERAANPSKPWEPPYSAWYDDHPSHAYAMGIGTR